MSVVPDPAGNDARDAPLSSIEIRAQRTSGTASGDPTGSAVRPLVLQGLHPAPDREIPEHVFDPFRQLAVDPEGRPLAPQMAKDWTTIEGTHTDGDGGDNEMWHWEEV
jgi:putative ATP-grasp target RiPP